MAFVDRTIRSLQATESAVRQCASRPKALSGDVRWQSAWVQGGLGPGDWRRNAIDRARLRSQPCLVLAFERDIAIMRSVAEGLEAPPGRGIFVTDFQGPLSDCALSLVRLLETPKAIATIYLVIMREICNWLLTGPHGEDVARMTLVNSPSRRVIDAMHSLRGRFHEAVRIDELAAIAQLSPLGLPPSVQGDDAASVSETAPPARSAPVDDFKRDQRRGSILLGRL